MFAKAERLNALLLFPLASERALEDDSFPLAPKTIFECERLGRVMSLSFSHPLSLHHHHHHHCLRVIVFFHVGCHYARVLLRSHTCCHCARALLSHWLSLCQNVTPIPHSLSLHWGITLTYMLSGIVLYTYYM